MAIKKLFSWTRSSTRKVRSKKNPNVVKYVRVKSHGNKLHRKPGKKR